MTFKLPQQKKFSAISFNAARFFSLLIVFSAFSAISFAQAPPNDNACQAIVLTPGATCTYQQFTNLNATGGTGVSVPACGGYVAASSGDVWFKVTVPAGGALTFDTQNGTMTDGAIAIYRGNTCVAISLVPSSCDDNSSANPNMPKVTVTGLTPGSSVYARVWSKSGTPLGTFGICVTIPVPAPPNDEPCTAQELTVGATCSYSPYTNESATNSNGVPAPVCAGFLGGDVWFKAVVPSLGAIIFDTQNGGMIDGGMAVYTGPNCNTLTFLDCDDNSSANTDMPKLTVAGLTPGDTVWVRVWASGNVNNGTFGICATLPPPPPINDGPCTAISLTVDTACNFVQFTNENALGTSTVADPGCAGYAGGDVWFTAIAPAGGVLTFDTEEGVVTDGGMAIYIGTCNNLTLLSCNDDAGAGNMPKITLGGFTPGDTVWIRVWENGNDNNGTFGICVKIPPPPPVNDEACNAITLAADTVCTFRTFTNENATGSTSAPDPGCANFSGADVWFNVIVPPGGALIFDSQADVITDGGMAVYTGTCGNLTLLDCNDDGGAGNMPRLDVGGLTPGDTVWVRFWEYGGDNNGQFGICAKIPPPAPLNDNPCGAFELLSDTVCNYQTFTNESATNTSTVPDPGCADYLGGDVWFRTIVPAGGALTFDTRAGVLNDGGMAVYSGTCTGLTLIACDDNSSSNTDMPRLALVGLNPGDTLWVRVWDFGHFNPGTFDICVKIPPPAPVNDNPCAAIALSVDSTCSYTTYTNESATGTTGVPAPGCAGYGGGDVWFTAIVPSVGGINFDTQTGTMLDGGMAVYSGNCGNLTLISCDDNTSANGNMPRLSIAGVTPGDTLWVRVWENGNNNNGTFGICASIPPPPPVNDNPCNATLIVAADTCAYTTYTNESATGTTGVPAPGCAGYTSGDVWFKAVVPAGGAITFDTQEGVMTDGGMAVYSGSCTNLTLINCDDNSSVNGLMPKLTIGSLTPGDTVWVRIWENGNNNNGTFGLCAKIPPPPPANDEPCNSFNLIPDSTCTYSTYTTENATNTPGVTPPGCAFYQGGDVWFNVIVPSGGSLSFDSQTGVIFDGGMAVYSGSCNNLTLLDCNDDGSDNGNMPSLTVGGLIPGDTLWVRFWEYGNDNPGTFGICVTLPPPGPVNDDPCGAIELPVSNTCTYLTYSNENSFGTASVPDPGCGDYQGGDVWFTAIVPAAGALTFDTQADDLTDADMAVYTGSCGNLTLVQCDDNSGAGFMPKITVGGLTPGDTVWIRVWDNGDFNRGNFGICVTIPPPPPANDNPCGAFTIIADTVCNYQTFSNAGAYGTASVPAPPCGNYQGADVWFQVTAPAAGALNINTQAGTLTDNAMAVYTADSCNGTMTLVACDDNASSNADMAYITATGLTPGNPVFIRVWSPGGAVNAGTFGICAVIPPLQPATFSFSCARDTIFSCGGGDSCFTLSAIIPDIHALTDRYAINPLSAQGCFNPYSDPGNEGPSTDLNTDDVYSDIIPLPFTFPFFGTDYNSLVASTNGYVSFDAAALTGTFSHWNIINTGVPQDLPSTFYDRALIMGPYHDLDPQHHPNPGQRIKYNITGQAPHRRWILSFYRVPLYSDACANLVENTHQIVLYEGTGVVEVFLFDMQNCLGWNQGRAMVGMQDFSRTRAIMAPGRKASDAPWGRIGMNESWRFVPIGGPTLFKRVELFDTAGHFLATGDTSFLDSASLRVNFTNLCALNRLPAGLNTLLVRAVYSKFNDPTQEEVGADTVRIFIPNLKVNFNFTDARCDNPVGAIAIHAINGVAPLRFSSDSGRTWQSDSSFANLNPGTYYVKVQDAAGCARDTIVTVSAVSPLHPAFTITDAACNGGTGTVEINTNGIRPIRYSSDAGATFQYDSTFALPAGTYTFRITDTAGCTIDTVITVTEPSVLSALYAITPARCNGAADGSVTVTAAGGAGSYTYSFDTGIYGTSNTASFAAGPHTISIKDANGCTKDTTINITEPPAIFTTAVITAASCNGSSDGSIVITAVGGTGSTYDYSKDAGANYQPGNTFSGVAAGTYSIRVRDANGCTKDTSVVVDQPTAINTPAVITAATCNGASDGSIVLSPVGGAGSYQYSKDTGVTYQPGNTFSALTGGTYTIRVKDANACTKDTTIVVGQPVAITSTAVVTSPKCNGGSDGSIVITGAGGAGGYQYSIDTGATYQAGATFTVAAGTYSIRIKDVNGCTKDTSITVTDAAAIQVTVATVNESCSNTPNGQINTTVAGGTAAYNYSKDGVNFQSSANFTGVTQGSYTITVRDANGCTASAPAQVGFTFDLSIQGRTDTAVCDNGRVRLNTTSNAQTYRWRPANTLDDSTIASPFASPTVTTDYILTATLGSCTLTDTVTIVVAAPPTVFAGDTIEVIKGADAQLQGVVTNTANFIWSPSTYLNNPNILAPISVMPQQTITYGLTVFNAEGCSRTDSVTVVVLPYCIKVKNAFTPNGDGVNDNWMVYDQYDCLSNVRVQVFNRYGSKVFESRNYRNDWNGTYGGDSLPDATYYYVIDYTLTTGRVLQLRGDVTILR